MYDADFSGEPVLSCDTIHATPVTCREYELGGGAVDEEAR